VQFRIRPCAARSKHCCHWPHGCAQKSRARFSGSSFVEYRARRSRSPAKPACHCADRILRRSFRSDSFCRGHLVSGANYPRQLFSDGNASDRSVRGGAAIQITESEKSLPDRLAACPKWCGLGATAGKVLPTYERVNVCVMVAVNHLPKITSARLKGSSTASRYGRCYHPRIACRQARQRARQGNRIGLFESRIGSTGPGATNRVNCWFRPTFPHLANASVPANESARHLAGQNPPDGNLVSSLSQERAR
jgi:hypothetical protein